MPLRGYHITFETDTHYGEAEVEAEYRRDPDTEEFYAMRGTMQFFEISLTSKRTGLTESSEDMPEDILNTAKDAAEEQFEL